MPPSALIWAMASFSACTEPVSLMAMVPVVECRMPTVTLSSSTFRPVVMILAVGKSAAFVVDFSKPGGSSTVAPLASVERSVAAGAATFWAFADESVAVEALEDLLHALLDSATHKKALGRTSDKAPRKPRLRLEKTDCMGVSISKGSLERGVRAIEPVVTNT